MMHLDMCSYLYVNIEQCFLHICCYRLENALRNFACLTTGDVIAINYNEKVNIKVVHIIVIFFQ